MKSWVEIPNQPNYLINLDGMILNRKKNKILKPIVSKGYARVYLSCKGLSKRKPSLIHRLVVESFNGPILEGFHVDHIDGNKLNNNLRNLRVCSPSENFRNTKPRNQTGRKGVYKTKSGFNAHIFLPCRTELEEAVIDYKTAIELLSSIERFKTMSSNLEKNTNV